MKAFKNYFKKIFVSKEAKKNTTSKKGTIPNNLTQTELIIFNLIMKGMDYKAIGKKRNIKRSTVAKHASNIFFKTKIKSRKELERKYKKEEIEKVANH